MHNALIKPTGNITQSCALRGNFKNSYEEGGILIDKFFLLASVCIYAVKFFCSRESVIFIKTYRNKTNQQKHKQRDDNYRICNFECTCTITIHVRTIEYKKGSIFHVPNDKMKRWTWK